MNLECWLCDMYSCILFLHDYTTRLLYNCIMCFHFLLRFHLFLETMLDYNNNSFCFQATDAYHVFTSGQAKIQQGLLHEGYELISEALNLLNNVYGAMHPEIAACARLLARLSYIMGDYGEVQCYVLILYFQHLCFVSGKLPIIWSLLLALYFLVFILQWQKSCLHMEM